MDTNSYKTVSLNGKTVEKEWVVIDAEDLVLGRLCTEVAMLLRGKRKPSYTPHADCGDHVIIINAEKIKMTGNKWTDKVHLHHTGFPGGLRGITSKDLMAKNPTALVQKAVKGMLPKNRLGRQLFRNLHVYAGVEHPHDGQQPKEIKL